MSASHPDEPPSTSRSLRAPVAAVLVLAVVAGAGWWWMHRPADAAADAQGAAPAAGNPGAGKADAGARKAGRGGTPNVVVARTRRGDIDLWADSLGTVTPLASVTIHSRVDGQLLRVAFQEGQRVQRGALLAEIDPRPFQVALDQALAQQARDRAQLENARVDLARYQDLAQHDAVPRQQLDTQASLVAQYEATLRNDQAAIDSARLQLGFCRIEAPVGGQVGLRQIDPGNMVHASDATGLVTVTQMEPISVLFSLPQDQLPLVQRRLRERRPIPVEAYDRAGSQRLAAGVLASLDNQIDTTTGAVKLRGRFANQDGALFPNQFVNLRVLLETRHDAVIAPTAALQRGALGTYMYVLKPDRTVGVRPVTVGPVSRNDIIVEQGLDSGDQVVVDGTDKLRDGMAVTVAEGRAAAATAGGKRSAGGREPR